jgi:hypothetical protein
MPRPLPANQRNFTNACEVACPVDTWFTNNLSTIYLLLFDSSEV